MDRLRHVTLVIEIPKGAFRKIRPDGSLDFWSPLPCPFNYGSIVHTHAPDGDPQDAVFLGSRRARWTRVDAYVVGVAEFHDAGMQDHKWICSTQPMTVGQQRAVRAFFTLYAVCKRQLNGVRGASGRTTFTRLRTFT